MRRRSAIAGLLFVLREKGFVWHNTELEKIVFYNFFNYFIVQRIVFSLKGCDEIDGGNEAFCHIKL